MRRRMRRRYARLARTGLAVLAAAFLARDVPAQERAPGEITGERLARGARIFEGKGLCSSCHGAYGVGGIAPTLSDGNWLHSSGRYDEIVRTVRLGVGQARSRTGIVMPALGGARLTDEEVRAVSAYVWSLSHETPVFVRRERDDDERVPGRPRGERARAVPAAASAAAPVALPDSAGVPAPCEGCAQCAGRRMQGMQGMQGMRGGSGKGRMQGRMQGMRGRSGHGQAMPVRRPMAGAGRGTCPMMQGDSAPAPSADTTSTHDHGAPNPGAG